MISKSLKEKFDKEVYDFYKPALEGPGFDFPFTEADVELLRKDEITRHAANLDSYECSAYDDVIKRDGLPDLPVRVYRPAAKDKDAGDSEESRSGLPIVLYFHGGGFVMGSIVDHDPLCGKISDAWNAVVVSVEYRLAPEYKFPACVDDAVDSAKWAYEHADELGGDREKIIASGDSSGANISTVLAMLARDSARPSAADDAAFVPGFVKGYGDIPEVWKLVLFYGVFGCLGLTDSESAKLYGNGDFVLPNNSMVDFMKLYLPEEYDVDSVISAEDIADYRLAPGQFDLSDMPDSIVVTAEFDPLRDDGEEFARRMEEAGNKTKLIRMDGFMHGFILYWQRFSKAKELIEKIGGLL